MPERKITKANRGFKGIWIPACYWLDPNLTIQEMLFLAEIDSLDIDEKGCYASNKHFSDFFGVTTGRCSQVINSLKEKEYISIGYVYGENKQIEKRVIRVVNKLNTPIKNIKGGYLENAKGSNTLFSNTSSTSANSENEEKNASSIPYKKIFDHLSKQSGKRVLNTSGNRDQVKARWNELKSITDDEKLSLILQMIDTKSSHAKNPLNNFDPKYLVVSTLFRKSNFAKYLEQDPNLEDNWELINKERAKQQNKPKNNFDINELENLFGDPNEPEF